MSLFHDECIRRGYKPVELVGILKEHNAGKYNLFALVDKRSNGDIFSIGTKADITREFLILSERDLSIDIILLCGQLHTTIEFPYEKDGLMIDSCYEACFDLFFNSDNDDNYQLFGLEKVTAINTHIHSTILENIRIENEDNYAIFGLHRQVKI